MRQILNRLGIASAALALALLPALAGAQDAPPSYATGPAPEPAGPPPSYAHGEEQIHGVISGFDGKYILTLRDSRGYVDNVELHDGTVINPTGLRLAGGMTVTIFGHANGSHFEAAEIDTPYHRAYAYGPGPYYPYPVYGYYGYPYGGPYFAARIGFGFR